MEGRGILLHGQVNQAQVVEDLPIKRSQVVGPLEAADCLHTHHAVLMFLCSFTRGGGAEGWGGGGGNKQCCW